MKRALGQSFCFAVGCASRKPFPLKLVEEFIELKSWTDFQGGGEEAPRTHQAKNGVFSWSSGLLGPPFVQAGRLRSQRKNGLGRRGTARRAPTL